MCRLPHKEYDMATNLALDPFLLDRVVAVSGESTKKAAVTLALKEFIARREQRRVAELFGKLEWDSTYDYKAETLKIMTLLVDTSVWSLALRRDSAVETKEVIALREALEGADSVVTTGLILQELLQGFSGPTAKGAIIERFGALPLIQPDRQDHVAAAEVRNACRRGGVQIGTIDALLVQLCGRYEMTLLSSDQDFVHAARHVPIRLWGKA